ncbi:hypothetical protein PPL_11750 [Heterostelium album PN500]|uniref:TOG domain-containing protein n=1 Tax=Heterostelium pallidum (strain ATCC 26659 / Pp 5 / PN500) TaxID=670386 RepID=D3BUD1_HETP5|nr:hypothetical protein PPL_11750 [Heterostelium album PN500]EFA74719.1 hypothetical protein PPL_11750 [Heterostelium album PN500]|eukprot:XP_020426853.1 hypothetical protein PPL_11750 [Heterostelium album PN500]
MTSNMKSRMSVSGGGGGGGASSTSTSSLSSTSRLNQPVKHDMSPIDFDSEKDLQKQMEEISAEFKLKESRDWSFRYKALIQLQRVVAGNAVEMKNFVVLLRQMSPGLVEQVTELRSTIVKEACAVVSQVATRLRSRFEPLALLYMNALLKVVVVKVTIIAEAAHNAIKSILNSVQTKTLLANILIASGDQHNEALRRRASEYLLIILGRAIDEPDMVLMSSVAAVEAAISRLLVDGGSDIRANTRLCFWAYLELSEERALAMLYEYTPTTQKNLFSMINTLPPSQHQLALKIQQALLEEDQDQQLMTESTDLDFDMNDFKKDQSTTTTTTTSSSIPTSRAKTPTGGSSIPTGRQSGLKGKISTTTTTTTTTPTGLSSSTSSKPSSSTASGSSLRGASTSSTVRSKSSLGMTKTTTTPVSSTSSRASSASPNVSSSNLSGRYSSIGSRISQPTTGKPTLAQTLKSSQTKLAAITNLQQKQQQQPASLTKSKSSTSLGGTSSTSTPSSSTTTTSSSTISKRTTSPSSTTKTTSASSLSKSTVNPTTTSNSLTKSIRPSTTTSTASLSKSTIGSTSLPSTSSTPTKTPVTSVTSTTTSSSPTVARLNEKMKALSTSTSASKPTTSVAKRASKEIDEHLLKEAESILDRDVQDIGDVDDLIKYSNTIVESLAKIDMEIDSLQDSQFNEISDALATNIRDAKRGLSLIDDDPNNELKLEDLELDDNDDDDDDNNDNDNTNTRQKNLSRSSSIGELALRGGGGSTLRRQNSNEDFNWIEDSVDQTMIGDDLLEFDDNQLLDDQLTNHHHHHLNGKKKNDRHNLITDDDDDIYDVDDIQLNFKSPSSNLSSNNNSNSSSTNNSTNNSKRNSLNLDLELELNS